MRKKLDFKDVLKRIAQICFSFKKLSVTKKIFINPRVVPIFHIGWAVRQPLHSAMRVVNNTQRSNKQVAGFRSVGEGNNFLQVKQSNNYFRGISFINAIYSDKLLFFSNGVHCC